MSVRSSAQPLSDADMTPEQQEATRKLRVNGILANGFRVGLRAWNLFKAHTPFSLFVMAGSSVPPRLRELAIIRVAHNNNCEYEFRHHAQVGLNHLGMSQQDIDNICTGDSAPGLSELDAQVIRLVDQLRSDCNISDELYAYFTETFTEDQFMELMYTIGNYESMTRVINVLDVPMDKDFDIMHGVKRQPSTV